MKTRLSAGLGVLALLIGSPSAQAQTPEERARAHFAEGQRLVQQGRCDVAYTEFASGYELSRRPLFLFNMAECARQTGNRERARSDYERYLTQDPTGAMAETARARLTELGPAPTTAPTTRAAASRPVTSTAAPTTAAAAPRRAQPPPQPAINARSTTANLALTQTTDDTARDEGEDKPLFSRWPFWVAVGGVVIAGTVATVLLAQGSSSGSGSDCPGGSCIDLQ